MKYSVVLDRLQNLIDYIPEQSELCKITGVKQSTMSNRSTRNSDFSSDEIVKLNEYYNVNLFTNNLDTQNKIISNLIQNADRVEINYWENLPEKLKKPKVASVWFDREIIENQWGLNPESLCIVPMVGDSLTNYWYPIRNGDILIIDTKVENIMGNGVYFGTSRNNSRLWIREMCIDINLNVEFRSYSPSGEEKKVYTLKELEEVDFKLIGKVIKNVSFRL